MEIAIVGATAAVTLDGGTGRPTRRIAITALAPTIHRVRRGRAALAGQRRRSDGAVEAAAAAAAAAARPISDVRGSDRYRRAMAAVIAAPRRRVRARRAPAASTSRSPPARAARGSLEA